VLKVMLVRKVKLQVFKELKVLKVIREHKVLKALSQQCLEI
jgi:hypothetical protein